MCINKLIQKINVSNKLGRNFPEIFLQEKQENDASYYEVAKAKEENV